MLGASAVAYLLSGKSDAMVGVQGGEVALVPFKKMFGIKKDVSDEMIRLAQVLAT